MDVIVHRLFIMCARQGRLKAALVPATGRPLYNPLAG